MFENTQNSKIETGVDRLLSLIEKRNIICISDASRELKVEKKIVEHWCDALAEKGIIKIRFSLNDKILMSPEYFRLKNKNISVIKNFISMNLNYLNLSRNEKGDFLENKEREINKKIKALAKSMEKLNRLNTAQARKKNLLEDKEKALRQKIQQVSRIEIIISKKEKLLEKREKELEKKDIKIMKKDETVSKILEKTSTEKKELEKKERKVMHQEKRVDDKIKKAENQLKEYSVLKSFVRDAKKDISQRRKELDRKIREDSKILDKLNKKHTEIKTISFDIKKRQNILSLILNRIKEEKKAISEHASDSGTKNPSSHDINAKEEIKA